MKSGAEVRECGSAGVEWAIRLRQGYGETGVPLALVGGFEDTGSMKKTLIHTNPHLADPERRAWLIHRQALESSIFEGARGLPPLPASHEAPKQRPGEIADSQSAADMASAKKSVSKSKSQR